MTRLRPALCLLALTGLTASLAQAAPAPRYGDVSVFVPFVNAKDLSDPSKYVSPKVEVGFDGRRATRSHFPVTMDTGSVGLIVGSDYFTPPDSGRDDKDFIGKGIETLTSSGVVIEGDWYRTTLNLFDGETIVATATVPVLAVTKVSCTASARDCSVDDPRGRKTHYFGVGFSGGSGQPQGTPDKNALLNITSVPGSTALPSPGYVLSTAGVQVGLTAANTQGFALLKLDPIVSPNATDWQSSPASPDVLTDWQHTKGTITVNGTAAQGGILFDTGVTTGFLTPPPGVTPQTGLGPTKAECNGSNPPSCAVTGTSVRVSFPQSIFPMASLNYTVGPGNGPQPGNPVSPIAVSIDHNGAPFLNTTVRFLQGFDYLYDAANGFTGLRATGKAPAKHATSKAASLSVGSSFACFFNWAAPGLSSPAIASAPTAYRWPYTYRFDSRRQVSIGISSGNAKKRGLRATKANEVYLITAGQPAKDLGPLANWLTAASCQ